MPDTPWDELPDDGFLRDADGLTTGRHEREVDGSEWMTQFPDGRRVGRYDPATNQTRDMDGNLVGWGNLLTSLLRRR